MVFIAGLYLLLDVLQHKGQARILLPKGFPQAKNFSSPPQSKSILISKNKNWAKGINTKERFDELSADEPGFECDVYFDTNTKSFSVHHDADKNTGFGLENVLQRYQQKKMQASVWLDIKNLDSANLTGVLQALVHLRSKYNLINKIVIESGRAGLLTAFSDNNFFTSYYIPFFNPYQSTDKENIYWADSIASVISKAKINALSGYYFQSSFLNHYFPDYPVLTWADEPSFSLVNLLFNKKNSGNKSIFILLKP